jgi:hypothetical protein
MRLPDRCPVSASGAHQVGHAAAEVCYLDDRNVDVDLDVQCELCGAAGHCVVSTALADIDIDWSVDTESDEAVPG